MSSFWGYWGKGYNSDFKQYLVDIFIGNAGVLLPRAIKRTDVMARIIDNLEHDSVSKVYLSEVLVKVISQDKAVISGINPTPIDLEKVNVTRLVDSVLTQFTNSFNN